MCGGSELWKKSGLDLGIDKRQNDERQRKEAKQEIKTDKLLEEPGGEHAQQRDSSQEMKPDLERRSCLIMAKHEHRQREKSPGFAEKRRGCAKEGDHQE